MQGKVLIVDAIATNRIVLKIKLASSFYSVLQATNIVEALEVAVTTQPDLVVTDLDLPDGNAADLCKGLGLRTQTGRIPVLAIAESNDPVSRKQTLAQGAQDVLVKPVPDPLLLSRVRSLIRAQYSADEWQMRHDASRAFGLAETQSSFSTPAHFQVVSEDKSLNHILATQLRQSMRDTVTVSTPRDALHWLTGDRPPDAFVLVLSSDQVVAMEQLQLISSIRANAATRACGILVLQVDFNADVGANALDFGADDLMSNSLDLEELGLRLSSIVNRKRRTETIQRCIDTGLREAIYDPLTGLYNRRYGLSEMARLTENATTSQKSFAVMVADIDHFKRINDAYGHASGDAVLIETACRLRSHLRPCDMVARIGGEEFLLVIPCTTDRDAADMAHGLCSSFRDTPFSLPAQNRTVQVTISIGICIASAAAGPSEGRKDKATRLIDQADQALYAAKNRGRNCVRMIRPAA